MFAALADTLQGAPSAQFVEAEACTRHLAAAPVDLPLLATPVDLPLQATDAVASDVATAVLPVASATVAAAAASGEEPAALGTGEPKVKRLKRKDMAAMDDASHLRRTWCLKCKSEGKASFAFKGSLSDKRNGLRHHMSQASSLLSPPHHPPPRSPQQPLHLAHCNRRASPQSPSQVHKLNMNQAKEKGWVEA